MWDQLYPKLTTGHFVGEKPYFSVEDRSLARKGGTGGTGGGGTGEEASLNALVPLSEWLLESGL